MVLYIFRRVVSRRRKPAEIPSGRNYFNVRRRKKDYEICESVVDGRLRVWQSTLVRVKARD